MRAFHIDRNHSLVVGKTYKLEKIQGNNRFSSGTKKLYKEGLSFHGLGYLSASNVNLLKTEENGEPSYNSLMIDYLYEYERLLHYPDKISRFQGFFVILDDKQVNYWLQTFEDSRPDNAPHPRLLEVEFDEQQLQVHDQNYLKTKLNDFSLQDIQASAKRYWNGEMTNEPHLEWLIKPPFKVIQEIPVTWDPPRDT